MVSGEPTTNPELRRLGPPALASEQDVRAALGALAAGPPGLVILGEAGSGKSALAGQVLARLHAEGWAVVAVVGRWSPRALFEGVNEAFEEWGGQLSPEQQDLVDDLYPEPPDEEMFAGICRLLRELPLAVLFDDLGQNLDGTGYLDPGFGAAFDRLCEAADRGRILVTSRTPLPADRLAVLRVGPLDLAGGIELAARLPFLSRLDPAAQQEVVRSIGAHPRSLQLADAWLSANPAAALTPGARPVDLVIAELTGRQRETLLQAALLTVPFAVRDLAVACDAGDPEVKERPEPDREALDSTRADAARLAELGLLTRWETREEDTVHLVDRWIAEQLAPHQGPEVADRHERALNMHYSRTHAGGTFDDYVGVCRHLVAVQGMGDLTHFVLAVTESLEPSYEFAGMALLGEILPHVPGGNGHHRQIRDHLVFMLIRHGFADGASVVAERSLSAVAEWAATHPQRDEARFCLGGAYDTCGQARFAAGRLEEAEAVLAVAVDIYHELAAEHPMFMEADQRLAGSLQNLGEVYRALDLPEQRDRQYEIWSECTTIRTRLFQATTTPEAALDAGLAFSRLAELATRDGDLDNARKLLGTRRAMLEAMAEMHPYDPRLAAELEPAEPAEPADDDDVLAILRRGPFAFNQWRADHAQQALDLSGTDLRGMNLDKMILAGANLAGANLSRASAREAIFSGADLTAANLAGADLTEAGFGYSEMVNATVAFTPLGRAMIRAATLTGAVFAGAILDGTSFRECDLTGVDLRGCDLSTLDLKRTSLEDAITDLA